MSRAFPRMLSNRWYSFGLSNLHISKRKNILFGKKKKKMKLVTRIYILLGTYYMNPCS